jgi:hypothetical protein
MVQNRFTGRSNNYFVEHKCREPKTPFWGYSIKTVPKWGLMFSISYYSFVTKREYSK